MSLLLPLIFSLSMFLSAINISIAASLRKQRQIYKQNGINSELTGRQGQSPIQQLIAANPTQGPTSGTSGTTGSTLFVLSNSMNTSLVTPGTIERITPPTQTFNQNALISTSTTPKSVFSSSSNSTTVPSFYGSAYSLPFRPNASASSSITTFPYESSFNVNSQNPPISSQVYSIAPYSDDSLFATTTLNLRTSSRPTTPPSNSIYGPVPISSIGTTLNLGTTTSTPKPPKTGNETCTNCPNYVSSPNSTFIGSININIDKLNIKLPSMDKLDSPTSMITTKVPTTKVAATTGPTFSPLFMQSLLDHLSLQPILYFK